MLQPPTMPSACTPTVCVPDATRLVKGRALRRSKLVVLLGELGRVEGIISVVEVVRVVGERFWMLLRLIQLLDDRPPQLLWHRGFDRIDDLAQLNLQLKDVGAAFRSCPAES